MTRKRRHRLTSTIDGCRVVTTYDAGTYKNGRTYIEKYDITLEGATWVDAIRRARAFIQNREAESNDKK